MQIIPLRIPTLVLITFVLLIGLSATVAGIVFAVPMCQQEMRGYDIKIIYDSCVPPSIRLSIWKMTHVWPGYIVRPFLDPYLYLILVGVLILERLMPAKVNQPVLSVGFFQDICWYIGHSICQVTIISVCWEWYRFIYENYLSALTIHGAQQWTMALQVAAAFLVSDFLDWVHHYMRHKVRFFWYFHAVHHSQRQINLFTDFRVHIVDELIASLIIFIPLLMFHPEISIVPLVLLWKWYPKLYHANVKSNFGMLRYVLVTPQSHRIHHSIDEEHRDLNFGVVFSFWDRLFGTLYPNANEYPETGIPDANFPFEQNMPATHIFTNYVNQMIYPFFMVKCELTQIFRRHVASFLN